MIPFVRALAKMESSIKIKAEEGLKRSPTFKLWMTCGVISNVILLNKFIAISIYSIS